MPFLIPSYPTIFQQHAPQPNVGTVVPKTRILISVTEARGYMDLNPHTTVDKTGHKWVRLRLVGDSSPLKLESWKNKNARKVSQLTIPTKSCYQSERPFEGITVFFLLSSTTVLFLYLFFSFVPLSFPSMLCPVLRYNTNWNHIFSYRCHSFDHRAATCVTT